MANKFTMPAVPYPQLCECGRAVLLNDAAKGRTLCRECKEPPPWDEADIPQAVIEKPAVEYVNYQIGLI